MIQPEAAATEPQCERQSCYELTTEDMPWLSSLANRQIGEDELTDISKLVKIGSIDLRGDISLETTRDDVLSARTAFFGDFLGWNDEQHPLHDAYKKSLDGTYNPLSKVIGTQRVLQFWKIDPVKVIKKMPSTLGSTPELVYKNLENLQSWEIEPGKAVNKMPTNWP